MTETLALETLTPPEIERLWQEALGPAQRLEKEIRGHEAQLRRYRCAGGPHERSAQRLEERLGALRKEFETALLAEAPFRAEWERRGGWTRYYAVPGKGHVHALPCFTVRPMRTLIGLVVEASGMEPQEVVARFAYTACTHCFPEAPVARPEPEGLCEYSGAYAPGVPGAEVPERWSLRAVAPHVTCPCGYRGAITRSGRFRKHKPGGAK